MKAFLLKTSLASLVAILSLNIAFSLSPALSKEEGEINLIEIPEEFTVNVFPNPNNGIFEIITTGKGEIKEVIIYNVIGEKVFYQLFDDVRLKADISNLDKGLYLLQVYNKSQNKILTKRFYLE